MRKKYELYEIKKYYNEYQQGRGLGVYSGREEAVAAIPYIIPGNPRSREISAREMPDSLNFAPDVVYHIVCEGGAEGYWGIVETEIPDRDTDAVKAHLEHNPWLAQPYQNFVRLERECCGMTISPGLDDTALYYLAQNLRGAFSIAGVPEDYFAFLKLVGGFAYYGRFELYADNLITKNRTYNPEAVRGAVFEPE
ncbi:MAG: hypothetical protein FWH02_08705, partial [Oscillospiraceae bacterium]|nr:hypothetical protein [Oscillospiraceae bacterium]